MQLLCTLLRSGKQQIVKIVSLQVPALKYHCKLLSVLPQDSFLNPDVVKVYLVLFGSLISKPDLFAAHRDHVFYSKHNKSRMSVERMVQTSARTLGRCSLTVVEMVP